MILFFKKITSSVFIPIAWTVLAIVLLCLPGSALPGGGVFDIPHLDKMIHVMLFGGIAGFWCLYFFYKSHGGTKWHITVIAVALCTIGLGICMEYIQLNFIPNRAFDKGDILANTLSAITFSVFFYVKRP